MWIRTKETKHADFNAADAARTKWLNENPRAVPESTHKLRIKRRSARGQDGVIDRRGSGEFTFIVWDRVIGEKHAS